MSTRSHNLKTWPDPFAHVWIGTKTAEFRRADRDFRVGDEMILSEWEPETKEFTGRSVVTTITHIAAGFGIPLEHRMLSFRVNSHEED